MITQNEVWVWALAGMGLVALAFIYVVSQAGRTADAEQVQHGAHAIRRWWFIALVLLGVFVTTVSLRAFPIADQTTQAQHAQIVQAVGRQWGWDLSQTKVLAGTPVEFNVTSTDVNHGFAIYSPHERILTQTQAMPGFTNRLLYTFSEPGKYRIVCLEYCGLAHHGMVAEFEVVAAGGSR
jgi:cytochrome c oxidase subunit 2